MSDKQQPWTEERITVEAESLAAHFKTHDLDHYEMSRLIVRDMRQMKDSLQQRITDLEAEVTKWRELAEGTASLWVEAREELAKLREEQWQPVTDYNDGALMALAKEDMHWLGVNVGGEGNYYAIVLPDDLRLCKRTS